MVDMKKRPRAGDRIGYQRCKRVFDVVFTVLALLAIWPVMLLIALLVFMQDGGGALYSQERLGRRGKRIRIWKFRSMIRDADRMIDRLTDAQKAQYRAEFKIDDDPRVTRLGAFLRRSNLDELPQLWNILRGDMSLVGPRPIVPEEIGCYTQEEQELFHSVPPGLTGYWQVCAGPEDTYTTGGRQRMELRYAEHAGFAWDCRLIMRTFMAVTRKIKNR